VLGLLASTALLGNANRREREAREQAVRQEQEAAQQRDLARANFQMARDAVEEYCTKVSKDPRLLEQDLHGLRQELLRSAARFHQQFVTQHAGDPNLRSDLGRAYRLLAGLTGQIEDARKAIPIQEQALAVFEELTAAEPENPTYREQLATCYNNLGLHYQECGNYERALENYRQAVGQWGPLVQAYPGDSKYATGLGGAHVNAGYIHRQLQDLPGARRSLLEAIRHLEVACATAAPDEDAQKFLTHAYDHLAYNLNVEKRPEEGLAFSLKSLALRKKLIEAQPGLPEHWSNLGRTLQVLAFQYRDLGKLAEAEQTLQEAVAMARRAVEQQPRLADLQVSRCIAHGNLATFYARHRQPEKAIPHLREAAALRTKFLERFPSNTPQRLYLAGTYLNLGEQLTQLHELEEARRAFAEGIKTLEAVPMQDGKPARQVQALRTEIGPAYACVLARLGRHAEAAETVEALLTQPGVPPQSVYRAACALGLASSAANADAALAAERQRLVERYAGRALALLKQAQAAGFFKDPARVEALTKTADLAPLRSRDDFRQWLGELQRESGKGVGAR
jgi:tetratricopeptide (TPR) repeat protein